ncbi:DUF6973 domain-containing protein [Flagellimonas sp.]|uniref:DUF6973 domain-containing protein n=1 Tax=Flagellimonas sp. TaxID=2058762 RepID=UPI003BAF67F5
MLAHVIFLGFSYPLFIVPTLRATKKCMKISTALYGRAHYKNGPANAFRHALWNYLIAKECNKWSKNQNRVLNWTQKITDWHEMAFPNWHLARLMDLHNNQVGQEFFKTNQTKTETKAIELLKTMATGSILITANTNLTSLENSLVHITEKDER